MGQLIAYLLSKVMVSALTVDQGLALHLIGCVIIIIIASTYPMRERRTSSKPIMLDVNGRGLAKHNYKIL